jgi:hypothetical protein
LQIIVGHVVAKFYTNIYYYYQIMEKMYEINKTFVIMDNLPALLRDATGKQIDFSMKCQTNVSFTTTVFTLR